MKTDFKRVLESKRAFRKQLSEKPIAEKLRIVEDLAERTLATRKDTSAPLPEAPWPIPENWRWARMGDVATIVGGSTPRTDRSDYFGGEIPWITPADLSGYEAKTISVGWRGITQAGLENSGARLLPTGTVLFSSRAPIGYVAIAANPVATNQGFKSFVLNDELLPDFVYYYLQRAKEFAVALASGTTFLEISGKNAARLPVPIPPLEEQRRIVVEIEKQFTRLEAGVAALRRVQANLKRFRAAVLKAASGGKVPHEPISAAIESLDQGWSPKCEREPSASDDVWAVIKTSAIQHGRFLESQNKRLPASLCPRPHLELQAGDLLITRAGPRARAGVACLVKSTRPRLMLCDKAYRVRAKPNVADRRFLEIVLNAPHILDAIDELKTGISDSGVNLTQKGFSKLVIPLPPLVEQRRIVAEVEQRLSVAEELEAAVIADLLRATRLRQSMLQDAFSGRISGTGSNIDVI
jgi:type I restriction enzyme S subunit